MLFAYFVNSFTLTVAPKTYSSQTLFNVVPNNNQENEVNRIFNGCSAAFFGIFFIAAIRYAFIVKKIQRLFFNRIKDDKIKADSSISLFYSIYCLLLLLGVQYFLFGLSSIFFNNNNRHNYIATNICNAAIIFFVFFVALVVIGRKKNFYIIARLFEENIERTQQDRLDF